ncbi:MAG: FHA domain-containing protein [Ktedonobacteraceae bacterium]|nr:FHA domain-containing protein [Ktedonobacteraceae bacterium]
MSLIKPPARLLLCSQAGEVMREYTLEKTETTIGRGSARDIRLSQDKLISRRHAVIVRENDDYILRDEGSVNGTLLNGEPVEVMKPYVLNHGDRINLGRLMFVFQASEDMSDLPTIQNPLLSEVEKAVAEAQHRHAGVQNLHSGEQKQPGERADVDLPLPVAQVAPSPVLSPAVAPRPAVLQTPPAPSTPLVPSSLPPEWPGAPLRFTAFLPQQITASNWYVLLLYAHVEQAATAIYKDASLYREEEADSAIHLHRPGGEQPGPQSLQGLPITVIPECPGVIFNPRRLTFHWQNDWHQLVLRISGKRDLAGKTASGVISFFAGPLLIARLKLEIVIMAPDAQIPDRDSSRTTQLYRRVFAAYSFEDTAARNACLHVYRALGNTTMLNIETLRSSRKLCEEVRSAIEGADVFQLCWSARAQQASYVTREWEYALHLDKGADFLYPVYWDVPRPRPPLPLSALHFVYLPAYTFMSLAGSVP